MIGFFDVKTSPVYFHAQKSKSYTTANTVVPFEILRLKWDKRTHRQDITHILYKLLYRELAKGNQIRLFLVDGHIHDNDNRYTSFVGQLLDEEIIQ